MPASSFETNAIRSDQPREEACRFAAASGFRSQGLARFVILDPTCQCQLTTSGVFGADVG